MVRRSAFFGGALLLLVVAIAWAQQPGGPGPGGPRGFGPPGGGFGPPGMMRFSPFMLAGMPEVQKELGLQEEQQRKIEEIFGKHREEMQAAFQTFDPFRDQELAPEEFAKRGAESQKKMETANKQLDEQMTKLLSAAQKQRLDQLQLQREGSAALAKEEIAKKLSLTDDQKKKLAELREQGGGGFNPFGPPPAVSKETLAVLTDAQRATWTELTGKEFAFPQPQFGRGGPGGPGGMMGQERKIAAEFDKDGDGKLSSAERKVAREAQKGRGGGGFGGPGGPGGPGGRPGGPGGGFPGGPGGPGGFPGFGGRDEPGKPGPHVSVDDVKPIPDAPLYEPTVLRTLFIEFENEDWETELQDFHGTDVEVPATLIVDGKKYPGVGIHFRGLSSYGMVRTGSKRSFNVAVDFTDAKQRLYGYKTLNLLNAHEDPTLMHSVLYSHIARQYIPAPKANFVKVVINGESWGIYNNVQQFDKIFLTENYQSDKGTRWKVPGSPGGGGGLDYVGDDLENYKRRFEIKGGDNDKAWKALVKLCRTLKETPAEQLEDALKPLLDIDGTLKFLALDNALINSDGYWIRASDYSIVLDEKGMFHILPHDMNETFQPPMGPGMGGPGGPGGRGRPGGRPGGGPGGRPGGPPSGGPGGPGGPGGFAGGGNRSYDVDPLVGLNDTSKPLRSRLLAVPALRAKYLEYVRAIAEKSLDWKNLGPVVEQYQALIDKEVEADTRKLTSYTAFKQTVGAEKQGEPSTHRASLQKFAQERRKYLLEYKETKPESRP